MEKERGKKYFLTKAIQCLFLFCSPWKVLTALGTTKQFTTGMWKKSDGTWNSFRVFFLQCMKRIFEKKPVWLASPKCPTPSSVGSWLWAGVSATMTLTYDKLLDIQIKLSAKNPGRCLFKDPFPFIPWLYLSPSGNTKISLSLFTLRFSEAIVVSCSGTVLCLCSPLPFVDRHGMTVHLFMIYFSQWLGPDYTDKHSRLLEGQLDLCNDTQTVLKLWEHFQTKKGKTPLNPPQGEPSCP